MERVHREKQLIGKTHPNLIEILDGGECEITKYIFVAMSYIERKNLSQVIKKVPRDKIFLLISQPSGFIILTSFLITSTAKQYEKGKAMLIFLKIIKINELQLNYFQ